MPQPLDPPPLSARPVPALSAYAYQEASSLLLAIMDVDAIELLAERLRTALQIEMHLTLAFEHAFRLGEKRVSAEVVEQVLSRAIDELEPTLTRNGYDAPALTVLLRAKPAEVRDFLAGTLAADRTREFTEQLRVAGVPV